jgi:hypothetical protein
MPCTHFPSQLLACAWYVIGPDLQMAFVILAFRALVRHYFPTKIFPAQDVENVDVLAYTSDQSGSEESLDMTQTSHDAPIPCDSFSSKSSVTGAPFDVNTNYSYVANTTQKRW